MERYDGIEYEMYEAEDGKYVKADEALARIAELEAENERLRNGLHIPKLEERVRRECAHKIAELEAALARVREWAVDWFGPLDEVEWTDIDDVHGEGGIELFQILSSTTPAPIAVTEGFLMGKFEGDDIWGYNDEGWRNKTLNISLDYKGWDSPVTVIVLPKGENDE